MKTLVGAQAAWFLVGIILGASLTFLRAQEVERPKQPLVWQVTSIGDKWDAPTRVYIVNLSGVCLYITTYVSTVSTVAVPKAQLGQRQGCQ